MDVMTGISFLILVSRDFDLYLQGRIDVSALAQYRSHPLALYAVL